MDKGIYMAIHAMYSVLSLILILYHISGKRYRLTIYGLFLYNKFIPIIKGEQDE